MYATAPWAARYNTWLLIKLTPKGIVFSFLFLFYATAQASHTLWNARILTVTAQALRWANPSSEAFLGV